MDTTEPYHYSKTRQKLPSYLSFACKKSDVDDLLNKSYAQVPFKTLRLTKHGGLRKNKVEDRILIALGELRLSEPRLIIYSVPRELAGTIRSLMKERGLPGIMARLQAWGFKSETWRLADHNFDLWFYPKTSELAFENEY